MAPKGPVDAASIVNRFCQGRGNVKPDYSFQKVGAVWECSLRIDGVAFDAKASASNQKEAKQLATYDFAKTLQASGLVNMMPPSKTMFKRGMVPKDFGAINIAEPAAKRAHLDRVAMSVGAGSTNGPLPVGAVDAASGLSFGTNKKGKEKSLVAFISQMQTHLRKGKPDDALQVCEECLAGQRKILTVKNLASIIAQISVRSDEWKAVEFLVTLVKQDLIAFTEESASLYFCRFARWAIKEVLAEGQASIQQALTVPARTLEGNGICFSYLTAQVPALKPGAKPGIELDCYSEGMLPKGHVFQKGDWVFVTFPHDSYEVGSFGEVTGHGSFEAEVVGFLPNPLNGITVKLTGSTPNVVATLVGQTCRVDRSANRVTYLRQISALRHLCDIPESLVWLRAVLLAGDEKDCKVSHGVEEALCSQSAYVHLPMGLPLWTYANESQKAAIETVMSRRLTLIQGPPGAGKTHTSVLIIKLWVSIGKGPVLVATESNVAVDNLVSGCVSAGLNVVRVGRPEVCRPDLLEYSLLEKARSEGKNTGERDMWSGEKSILGKAQVVCCTCSGCDQPVLEGQKFQSILIDEAAQATELAVVMPLLKLRPTGTAVLVGDHRQLPPTIICMDAQKEGFSVSLFERLASRGVRPLLLDVQYRMHPAIATFPSAQFYDGRLRSGVGGQDRPPVKGVSWPEPGVPVCFIPVTSEEAYEGNSYTNMAEAKCVQQVLQAVIEHGDISENNIGVITPYAAQARLLRKFLGITRSGQSQKHGHMGIEVSSVDGFQGREKDLIVVSTVRANADGKVGFLGDARRMNVTLTRARRGLVVCGEINTLMHDRECWKPWLYWAQQHGLVLGTPATSPEKAAVLRSLDSLDPTGLQQQWDEGTGVEPTYIDGWTEHQNK